MNDVVAKTGPAPQALAAFQEQGVFTAVEIRRMPKGMRILFDPGLRTFFEDMARSMADPANKMTPPHLKNDKQLCFAIIRRALNWNMDPYEVAPCTYNVQGNLGYYGRMIRGVMLNSGKVKEVRFEHGPSLEAWEKVEGKFETRNSKRTDADGNPKKYNVGTYTQADEAGLWCRGIAVMHDGTEVTTPKTLLRSCHPRNSTVWATSPMKQITEVVSRVLANQAVPDVMLGANFDVGVDDAPPVEANQPAQMRDITPEPEQGEEIITDDGEVMEVIQPEPEPEPEKTQGTRSPRLQVQWAGKTLYKTKFTTDIKQSIKACEDRIALAELHTRFIAALKDQSPEHSALLQELNPLFQARSEALLGPVEEETTETAPEPDDDTGLPEETGYDDFELA